MASTRPSPEGDAVPLAGTVQVSAGLRAHRRPILASLGSGPARPAIGDVGRAARRFSSMAFLPLSARRAASHDAPSTAGLPVRPADYWWGHRDQDLGIVQARTTGDAALDRLIAGRAAKREATAAASPRRGLPSTTNRRSYSLAGPLTAPGGVARRLVPAPVVPVPNPANSPQSAAGRSPRGRTASGPRSRAGDPARPAAATATANAATEAVARSTRTTASVATASGPRRAGSIDSPHPVAPAGHSRSVTSLPAHVGTAPVGRRVAVHPLVSGWRSPTAWRSVPAGPGVRLLPVGAPARLSVAGASPDVRRLPIAAPAMVFGASSPEIASPSGLPPTSRALARSAGAHPAGADRTGPRAVVAVRRAAVDRTVLDRHPFAGAPVPSAGSPAEGWVVASAASTAPQPATFAVQGATPGFRPFAARRPGAWLARPGTTSSPAGRHHRPLAQLGPLGRMSMAADGSVPAPHPTVGRTAAPAAGSEVRPPVSGGLALVRGNGDAVSRTPGRNRSHVRPADSRLRLVPALPDLPVAEVTADRRRDDTAPAPFVATPGAVAAHGLPSTRSSLAGATSPATGRGRATPAGTLSRLVHGPVPGRSRLAIAPPAFATFGSVPTLASARPGLPSAPAAVARRTASAAAPSPARPTRGPGIAGPDAEVPSTGGFDRRSAPRTVAATGAPVAAPRRSTVPAPSWSNRFADRPVPTFGASVASLRRLPVAPVAFPTPAVGGASGPAVTATAASRHRSLSPHGVSATVSRQARHGASRVRRTGGSDAVDRPSRALPGRPPSGLRPLSSGSPAAGTAGDRSAAEASSRAGRPLRPSAPGAAARFEEVLRTAGQPVRPVALPVRFRPLADRIVGRMPVMIATGAASRRALAAVGARAATTDSVIHLAAPPDASARTASIMAHEMTHVAAASPVPRFHGGRRSAEESAATEVERIVARAARTHDRGRGPSVVGTRDLPVGGFVGLRASTAGPVAPPSSGSAPSSSGGDTTVRRLPASGSGGSTGGGSGTIRRSPGGGSAGGAPATGGGGAESDTIRRLVTAPALDDGPTTGETVISEAAMDAIVRALEAKVLESIERRGGMWRGGF